MNENSNNNNNAMPVRNLTVDEMWSVVRKEDNWGGRRI
jgi:hypothetical protein